MSFHSVGLLLPLSFRIDVPTIDNKCCCWLISCDDVFMHKYAFVSVFCFLFFMDKNQQISQLGCRKQSRFYGVVERILFLLTQT